MNTTPEAKNSPEIKSNLSLAALNNWVKERTLLPEGASLLDKIKEEGTPIGAERKARASIVWAMITDSLATQFNSVPSLFDGSGDVIIDPNNNFVFGETAIVMNAGPVVRKIEALLEGQENKVGHVTVEGKDTITGEKITTTVGTLIEDDGFKSYFGQEEDTSGNIISRAVIHTAMRGKFSNRSTNYGYFLGLNYKGGCYAQSEAEIDISASHSPRATALTLKYMANSVINGLK